MNLTEEQIVQNLSLLGIWDRHDSSAVILTDGIPEIHVETEISKEKSRRYSQYTLC